MVIKNANHFSLDRGAGSRKLRQLFPSGVKDLCSF